MLKNCPPAFPVRCRRVSGWRDTVFAGLPPVGSAGIPLPGFTPLPEPEERPDPAGPLKKRSPVIGIRGKDHHRCARTDGEPAQLFGEIDFLVLDERCLADPARVGKDIRHRLARPEPYRAFVRMTAHLAGDRRPRGPEGGGEEERPTLPPARCSLTAASPDAASPLAFASSRKKVSSSRCFSPDCRSRMIRSPFRASSCRPSRLIPAISTVPVIFSGSPTGAGLHQRAPALPGSAPRSGLRPAAFPVRCRPADLRPHALPPAGRIHGPRPCGGAGTGQRTAPPCGA